MFDVTHSYVFLIHAYLSFPRLTVTRNSHVSDLFRTFVQNDSFIRVTWLIHTCDMTRSYVMLLIHTCDMTHSYVWRDSFIRVIWLIHTCDMTHSYVWHDSFIPAPDSISVLSLLVRDSFICVPWHIHIFGTTWCIHMLWHDAFLCVTWLFHICDMPRSHEWHKIFVYIKYSYI